MNKKDQAAIEELQAYLASRNEKTNKESDKRYIASKARYADGTLVEKIRQSNLGKTYTDDAKAKMSESAKNRICNRKGQTLTDETKAKLSAINLGKKLSAETRAKMKGRKAPNNRAVKTGWTDEIFSSIKLASEWAIANGIPNARKKIFKFLKTDPANFYYVDTK